MEKGQEAIAKIASTHCCCCRCRSPRYGIDNFIAVERVLSCLGRPASPASDLLRPEDRLGKEASRVSPRKGRVKILFDSSRQPFFSKILQFCWQAPSFLQSSSNLAPHSLFTPVSLPS